MTTPLPAWLDAFRRRLGAELIETHISWLLLAGEFAWKLKKPITLPFLDYGTPALRRRCCEEELRLNRRFAPALYLYLGLEAVGDSGEWAVMAAQIAALSSWRFIRWIPGSWRVDGGTQSDRCSSMSGLARGGPRRRMHDRRRLDAFTII